MMKEHHKGNFDLVFIPLFLNDIWMGLCRAPEGRTVDVFHHY